MTDYDSKTCITAKELRDAGIPVDPKILDVAWVPRSSIHVTPGHAEVHSDGSFTMGLSVKFSAPFNWIALDIEIGEPT